MVGGHSVRDAEMKFGYAVTGVIDPERVYTNAGAIPGDILILTKPIGTGVITTALKQGKSEPAWVERAIRSMTTLNSTASTIAIACSGVHAITDITGFGLMGHGREMAFRQWSHIGNRNRQGTSDRRCPRVRCAPARSRAVCSPTASLLSVWSRILLGASSRMTSALCFMIRRHRADF